jgi:acetolactate synthase I/II/III large subunit
MFPGDTAQKLSEQSVAALIARVLRARGVERAFGLCGGHIMPVWMRLDFEGIAIIDVRDERAAVHMAQAHAEVTGRLGVALVTAGPGVTNAMTGIANAHASRAPVLVLSGRPPRAQETRGALQDIDHTRLVGAITRFACTVREPSHAARTLDEAIGCAQGERGASGPAFIDFPTDVLRAEIPSTSQMAEYIRPKVRTASLPEADAVAHAADLMLSAKRPLVISGRGARGAADALAHFLDRMEVAYLDTGESRGLVPDDHPAIVASMRSKVMKDADLVVTIGRKLDFQLAYGSPAVFENARFVRIADNEDELRDNRRGVVELLADPAKTLSAVIEAAGKRVPARDYAWLSEIRKGHRDRAAKMRDTMMNAPAGSDGRMHPNRLLASLQESLPPDAIVIVDGGDFLSFARVGLAAKTVLDPGPFGCIGIGVPYGIAAALACPNRPVLVATGDGAFGFNAIELDTAVRHRANVVFVVANNGAWQIEAHDQRVTYGKVVGTRLQFLDHAAMARAFGMHAERVEKAEELPDAIERAFANRPALIDAIVTPEAISSDAKNGLAWVPDLQPLAAWDEAERAWRDNKQSMEA